MTGRMRQGLGPKSTHIDETIWMVIGYTQPKRSVASDPVVERPSTIAWPIPLRSLNSKSNDGFSCRITWTSERSKLEIEACFRPAPPVVFV
ncbi:hypothetical protein SAMN05216337_103234 [Bradyrhizobium brasilense]|uniref:Uncharacterized protein n=1 Tax=Bradyrhizobium brasilense TaxID=1419277 RepID=A0A1G7F176_9BRAD|nr:hypothetical protein SAMN05216337_103234 [Bradyrhizobium brasilense]